jgi:hypothetical protein
MNKGSLSTVLLVVGKDDHLRYPFSLSGDLPTPTSAFHTLGRMLANTRHFFLAIMFQVSFNKSPVT